MLREQVDVFMSLFRGRTDTYARYWEKNGRSGYSPAYGVIGENLTSLRSTAAHLKILKTKNQFRSPETLLKN